MTICVNCHWHKNTYSNRAAINVWYNHICMHPDVERPKTIDPVTGLEVFMFQNDLGKTVLTGEPNPACKNINEGNCSLYLEK
jgi:hypothetical protein